MAARGILPGAKPGDALTVLVVLAADDDDDVAAAARATLDDLPRPLLTGALSSDLQASVILTLAERYNRDADVVQRLVAMPRISGLALCHLAETASEQTGEVIAANETLLLQHSTAIEALYMNKRVRMSTADRLLELAVRNGLELGIPAFRQAAAAIVDELIAEPSDEETFDDLLFKEAEEVAREVALKDDPEDDTHERNEEGEEQLRAPFLPLHAKVAQMTISQRIRRAILGSAAERMLLIRDTNRLVATAAATSPQLNENDAARIAACRNVIDDVLRIIAQNRSFTRSYQVKLNLVTNPRTPFTFSARMIPHLRDNDLRSLVKSKNIPAAVQTAARQQLLRKNK